MVNIICSDLYWKKLQLKFKNKEITRIKYSVLTWENIVSHSTYTANTKIFTLSEKAKHVLNTNIYVYVYLHGQKPQKYSFDKKMSESKKRKINLIRFSKICSTSKCRLVFTESRMLGIKCQCHLLLQNNIEVELGFLWHLEQVTKT